MRTACLLPTLLGVAGLLAVALLPVSVPQGDDLRIADPKRPIGEIEQGVTVSQVFPATGSAITSLEVLLGTYQRINHGTLIVTLAALHGATWHPLAMRTLAKETIRDNAFAAMSFTPPLAVTTGERLRLTLQSPDGPGDGVAWWTNPDTVRDGSILAVNGGEQKGTACFAVTYVHPTGRLYRMVGPIWGRMTLFLNPGWRVFLLVGLATLAATFLVVSGILLSGVRWAARPRVDTAPRPGIGDGSEEARREEPAMRIPTSQDRLLGK